LLKDAAQRGIVGKGREAVVAIDKAHQLAHRAVQGGAFELAAAVCRFELDATEVGVFAVNEVVDSVSGRGNAFRRKSPIETR